MGLRAKDSFTKALRNAADSVQVVAEGAKLTYRTAGRMHEGAEGAVEAIRSMARENSTVIISRSTDAERSLIGRSPMPGSFGRAKEALAENYRTTGGPLAVLSSVRWVLQGLLWDATVKPALNITAASLGYIGVNFVAFPTMVVVREGVETAALAVQATWDAAKMGYDIVAPTGTAAVAGVYGVLDLTGSRLAAGAAAVGDGAVRVTGEVAAAGTGVVGNVLTAATLAGGTAASAGAGAAYGVYQVSKAVAVPAGYELGGGIVLSYGTLTHLAAHSVLAVSDCAYLVLSLEGPRWVIYAVKGTVSSGDDVAGGAVVDLRELQQQGEEVRYLPVSDEEMKKVVESVYENLPETKSENLQE